MAAVWWRAPPLRFPSTAERFNSDRGFEPPTFSNLTSSQLISYGTASVTLAGTVSGPGPVYPANGEVVTVTINGTPQSTTINDSTGDFSVTCNTATLPASGTPYTIGYSYGGDAILSGASDSSTALTVNPAALTVTASPQGKTYSQTLAFGPGSALFTSSTLSNGDTIGTVTLASSGGGANASATNYIITPSAATGGTFSPGNYNITYVSGTLTVNPLVAVLAGAQAYNGTSNAAASQPVGVQCLSAATMSTWPRAWPSWPARTLGQMQLQC